MTLGKSRKIMNSSGNSKIELYRFASKLGTEVVGGFSKLLQAFIRETNINDIITYASSDISFGNVYLKSGFIYDSHTGPGYTWVIDGHRKNRYNYNKQKLVEAGYDKNLSETKIMHSLGYYRCFDSGNLKFRYKK